MELVTSLVRSYNQTSQIAPVTPANDALNVVSGGNKTPGFHDAVEVDDIFSDLEVCRMSAARNLKSYLRRMECLASDVEASEIDTVVIAKDDWTKQHWRLKIDKDDLRRDLLEMQMILDFIITRSTNFRSFLFWILSIIPIPNFRAILLTGASYALNQAYDTRSQGLSVWMLIISLPFSFKERLMAEQCRRIVQQVMDALVHGTLDEKHADALSRDEFRFLRRFGRR